MFTTLDHPQKPCQQASLTVGTIPDMDTKPVADNVLADLDLVDLEILSWIIELGRATSKTLSEKIYLSRQAILHRARKHVDRGLVLSRSVRLSTGGIKPTSIFFPASGLTRTDVEKAIAVQSLKVQKAEDMKKKRPDAIGLLVFALIYRNLANTVPSLMNKLGSTESTTRSRAIELVEQWQWLKSEEVKQVPKRPGLNTIVYSSIVEIDEEDLKQAISQIDFSQIKVKFSLNPTVDWATLGLRNFSERLEPRHNAENNRLYSGVSDRQEQSSAELPAMPSNNGHRPYPVFQTESASCDVAASNGDKSVSHEKAEANQQHPQTSELKEVLTVLRTMAEKLAEYEDRLARLESRPQDSQVQQMSAEILAIIPPVAKKEAS